MAVIVPSATRAILSKAASSSPSSSAPTRNNLMSVLSLATAAAPPMQQPSSQNSSSSATTTNRLLLEHELEEEKKHAAQLVKALAERYGGRAIQRWSTEEDKNSQHSSTSASACFGTSPSTYQPFSNKWAARYWQLQKAKAEQMLAELEQSAREKSSMAGSTPATPTHERSMKVPEEPQA